MRDPRIALAVRQSRGTSAGQLRIFEPDAWDIHVTIVGEDAALVTAWNRRKHRQWAMEERTERRRKNKALDELTRLTEEMGGYDATVTWDRK